MRLPCGAGQWATSGGGGNSEYQGSSIATDGTNIYLGCSVSLPATFGSITLAGTNGQVGVLARLVRAPTLTSLTPPNGPVGTSVTLTGTGFISGSTVRFNGTAATAVTLTSATSLTATVPTGATSGPVTVTTAGGTSNGVSFTVAAPTITNVTPLLGGPGTVVTITGTGLTGTTTVYFGTPGSGPSGNNVQVNAAGTQVTFTVPTSALSGPLSPASGGTVLATSSQVYVAAPQLRSPGLFYSTAGQNVTFQGINLANASAFTINGVSAPVVSSTATSVTLTIPAAATSGPAIVTTPGGTAAFGSDYAVGATITGFTPTEATEGTTVTVSGTGFSTSGSNGSVSQVQAGSCYQPGPNFTLVSATELTFVLPVNACTGKVSIGGPNNPVGPGTLVVLPTVVAFSPASGAPGTVITVTVSGNYNVAGTAFDFNGTAAPVFYQNGFGSATYSVTVPAGATTGPIGFATTSSSNSGSVVRRGVSSTSFVVPVVGPVDLIVTTVQTVASGTYRNITVTGTGVATLTGNAEVTTSLVVQDGGVLSGGGGNGVVTGPGSFTLADGATLRISEIQGISTSGPTGMIQVSGLRTYSADGIYVYDRPDGAGQMAGNGLPATVRELVIDAGAGGVVGLQQPVGVRRVLRLLDGALGSGGRLTLLSSATQQAYAQQADGAVVLGPLTVERYINGPAAGGYHHLSSPVQATPVSDLATAGFTPKVNPAYNALPYVAPPAATFPNVFGYDETRGGAANTAFTTGYFSPATAGTTLAPGQGYSTYISGGKTPDFVGTPTTGDVDVALSVTGTAPANAKAGWALLGNPYPQPIDWDLLTTPAGLDASVFVWYSTGGSNGAYRVRNASNVGSLTNGLIGVGQAFFVRATAATTFPFTNALRVDDNVALGRAAQASRSLLTLQLTGAAGTDEVTIYEQAGATASFDGAFDAARPGRNVGVPTLSALINGEEGMISAVPEASLTTNTTVELLLDVPAVGAYAFAAATLSNLPGATLLDRATNTRYDLTAQPTVTFTATQAGEMRGRFALVFGQRTLGTADLSPLTSHLTVYPNPASGGGSVRVMNCPGSLSVTVFDLAGRRVATAVADATGAADVSLRELAAGVYLVRVADGRTARLVVQ